MAKKLNCCELESLELNNRIIFAGVYILKMPLEIVRYMYETHTKYTGTRAICMLSLLLFIDPPLYIIQ